jgi:hypothetical protein
MSVDITVSEAADAAATAAPPARSATFPDVGSTLLQQWTALVLNPDGTEFVLNPIADVTVNETFERVTANIDIPWYASGLPSVTDLVSDIVLLRGTVRMYRLRVLDSEDVLSREGHTVRLTCVSYEEILRVGRIIYTTAEMTGDQLSLAWDIVQLAQARQDLGITRYTTPVGTSKTVQLIAGATTAETIDKFAAEDDGFDWWIDQDLKFHCQEPRRETVIDAEWSWGAEIAEMSKQSSVESYVSATYVTGATSEVTIPGGATYPPPSPAVREVDTMPYGRWEKTFSYPNIVTNASLVKRADWHLGVGSRLRPVYSVVLEQGVWSPSVKLGGVVSIRAQANDRVNFKVPARIEELQLAITADGGETVSMLLRAEDEEIYIGTGTPAEVVATNTPPAGSTVVTVPDPTGLSKTLSRISSIDWLGTVIASLADRISREERT